MNTVHENVLDGDRTVMFFGSLLSFGVPVAP